MYKLFSKFSKPKLFTFVFALHVVLIALLAVSFDFQKPEERVQLKPIMNVNIATLNEPEPPAPVKEPTPPESIKEPEPEPIKKDPTPVKKPEPIKPKKDLKAIALEKKKKEEERKKKLAADKKKKELELKKKREADKKKKAEQEKKRKELERKKKLEAERKRKEAARQAQLAADRKAKAAAERVSNALESTYLQELGQKVQITWRQPSAGVQIGSHVTVRLTIERDGRISNAKIVGYSANSIMLASVKDLMNNLKRFKRFPAKITEKRLVQDFKLEIE